MRAAEAVQPGLERPAAGAADLVQRLRGHLRTPLHRDGYALVANSAFTAATGLVYWIVAAKVFSAHTVGVNSALISSMMLIAGLASLNLNNILVRFLPETGRRSASVVVRSYAVAAVVAAAGACVFLAGVSAWAPRLSFLGSSLGLEVCFVLSTVAWCVFVIQDSVLTALQRAVWVPLENAVFSLLKLALLAGAAALLPLYGIFVSWTAAMVVSVAGVNLLIFGRLMRRRKAAPDGAALTWRDPRLVRYFAADYAGAMAWLASVNLLPVLVTAAAGPTTNAYFALAWTVAFPLYGVAGNIGTSLVVHGTRDRAALPALVRKAFLQGLAVLVPGVILLLLLAPFALSLFGASYADHSATLLRILALGAVPDLVLTLAVSVARVQRRLRTAVIALTAQAAISLVLAIPLLHAFGVTGVGIGWLVSMGVVSAALLAGASAGVVDLPLTGGEPLRLRGRTRAARTRGSDLAERVLRDVAPRDDWTSWPARTDSDSVVFLAGRRPRAELALKIACSEIGATALAAQRRALEELHSAPKLETWAGCAPRIVACGQVDGHDYLVERALPGIDGRTFARGRHSDRALAATVRGLAGLHDATAVERAVDDRLFLQVVGDRLDTIRRSFGWRSVEPLDGLRFDLMFGLLGRRALVGRTHGDLWLGNALLSADGSALSGLVDWEASRAHDLPAVDVAHLLLSTRAIAQRRPLGVLARRMVDGKERLTRSERSLLAPCLDTRDPLDERTVVLLAWLQHVTLRLSQCTPSRWWLRRNLDPVLAAFVG